MRLFSSPAASLPVRLDPQDVRRIPAQPRSDLGKPISGWGSSGTVPGTAGVSTAPATSRPHSDHSSLQRSLHLLLSPLVYLVPFCLSPNSLAATDEATGWILHSETVGSLGWSERLAGLHDASIMGGYSRHVLPSATGLSREPRIRFRWASAGQHSLLPFDTPWYHGGQVILDGKTSGSIGPFFLNARPQFVIGIDDSETRAPHGDPRETWTGRATDADLDQLEWSLRLTAGVDAMAHLWAVSTEPFRWGEGIFGGIVAGSPQRGFPHAVVAPNRAWKLFSLANDPILLRYELVAGLLNDDRNGIEDPWWGGGRASLRWKNLTVSATLAGQTEGDGPNEWLDRGTFNGIRSVGLNWQWWNRAELRVEYGQDDNHPIATKSDNQWLRPLENISPLISAWTTTLDWIDVLSDQKWRLALEWYRSESYFYDHSDYDSWTYDDQLIAHGDGGNGHSLRLLLQHHRENGSDIGVLGYWRRLGWRNAQTGNPNTERPNNGNDPGEDALAMVPWDQFGLYTWSSWPYGGWGRLHTEAGLVYEEHRLFDRQDFGLEWQLGLGWSQQW